MLWPTTWATSILDETGPDFFARALADYLGDFRAVTVADPRTGREAGYRLVPGSGRDEVTVLHPWTVYPYYLHETWVPTDHPDAYAAHHWHNTWSN